MQYDEASLQTVRETRLLIDKYDSWLFDEFKPFVGQRILEVGCGLGNLISHFTDRELAVGIEPSDETVSDVRKRFGGHSNLSFYSMSITEPAVLALTHYGFDTAVSLNVFEHIEDDVCAMRHTRELLQPGGKFILIVPSHKWLYGKMDSTIGHYRRYDKQGMQEKMAQVGFKVLVQKYVNVAGALGWLVNGRVLRRSVPPTGQLRTFNALVPFLRKVESSFVTPVGISLMTVAQRAE